MRSSKHSRSRDKNSSKGSAAARAGATRRTVILAVVFVLIIGALSGIAVYREYVKPFRTTVLEVDGTSIKMRYFLKRLAMSDELPISMLYTLCEEEIIRQTATKPPFNVVVSDHDIDQFAKELAGGENVAIEDGEFREWYRQQLNEARLSNTEFAELLRTMLLTLEIREHLEEGIPKTAEQVFVNMIAVQDSAVGTEIWKKHEAGDDFALLAQEYSVDPELKENGGRVGWFPRGVLDPIFDSIAFELEVGEISNPISVDGETFVVMMISEKAADRKIDDQSLRILRFKVLDEWYKEEYPNHEVRFHGFNNGYDSDTDAWVNWQLSRMRRERSDKEDS